MFNNEQLTKLSDLFMDLAKSLFAAALLIPAVFSNNDMVFVVRSVTAGLFLTWLSLLIIGLKKVI